MILVEEYCLTFPSGVLVVQFRAPEIGELGWWMDSTDEFEALISDVEEYHGDVGWVAGLDDVGCRDTSAQYRIATLRWL